MHDDEVERVWFPKMPWVTSIKKRMITSSTAVDGSTAAAADGMQQMRCMLRSYDVERGKLCTAVYIPAVWIPGRRNSFATT